MLTITREERMNPNTDYITYLMSNELRGIKWSELFRDEDELKNALLSIDNDTLVNKNYKSYNFLLSIKHLIQNNVPLSPLQLTQLKRNSSEIYCYHWNDKNTGYHGK